MPGTDLACDSIATSVLTSRSASAAFVQTSNSASATCQCNFGTDILYGASATFVGLGSPTPSSTPSATRSAMAPGVGDSHFSTELSS
eukprot:2578151-Rhodomonas_salina.3